jgi:hypothetical protein
MKLVITTSSSCLAQQYLPPCSCHGFGPSPLVLPAPPPAAPKPRALEDPTPPSTYERSVPPTSSPLPLPTAALATIICQHADVTASVPHLLCYQPRTQAQELWKTPPCHPPTNLPVECLPSSSLQLHTAALGTGICRHADVMVSVFYLL